MTATTAIIMLLVGAPVSFMLGMIHARDTAIERNPTTRWERLLAKRGRP